MVSYHPLEHCFNDFVDCFNLAISLGVVGIWVLVFEFQHGWNLSPDNVFKMFTMVWDQLFGSTKSWNDVVKEEMFRHFTFAIEHGHGLGPLGEVINNHNDIFMTVDWGRVDCHEFDFPFIEGTNCDYGVHRCGGYYREKFILLGVPQQIAWLQKSILSNMQEKPNI